MPNHDPQQQPRRNFAKQRPPHIIETPSPVAIARIIVDEVCDPALPPVPVINRISQNRKLDNQSFKPI